MSEDLKWSTPTDSFSLLNGSTMYLISHTKDSTVIKIPKNLHIFSSLPKVEVHWNVTSLFWNEILITGGYDGKIRFADLKADRIVHTVELTKAIYCLKIVCDCFLITCGQGNIISIWDASKFKSRSVEALQLDLLKEIYGPDGHSIYALEVITLSHQDENVSSAPSITLIAAGGRDNYIHVWNLESSLEILVIPLPPNVVVFSLTHFSLYDWQQYSSSEQRLRSCFRLFAGGDNGSIYFWNIVCNVQMEITANSYTLQLSRFNTNLDNMERDIDEGTVGGEIDNNYFSSHRGTFIGHENVVHSLLVVTPFSDKNKAAVSSSNSPHKHRSRPILISSSRSSADVCLWQADYSVEIKESRRRTLFSSPSLIFRIIGSHSTSIGMFGLIQDQKYEAISTIGDHCESYHLLTCDLDYNCCVWEVCQILRDVNWQRMKLWILLAKQINLISANDDNSNNHSHVKPSKLSSETVKIFPTKLDVKYILKSICAERDIFCVVLSFLM